MFAMPVARTPDLPPRLLAGYARFRRTRFAAERERYRSLAEAGQRPAALIVACSDSRSAPEAVFDAGPGELFVVRNVAALVPVYAPDAASHGASAALEFGVRILGIPSIVVMGHGRCGGIAAALEGGAVGGTADPTDGTDFIGSWVAGLRELAGRLPASADEAGDRTVLERASIERSVANLRTFPWIVERERMGELTIAGMWFDIALGELHAFAGRGWRRLETETP